MTTTTTDLTTTPAPVSPTKRLPAITVCPAPVPAGTVILTHRPDGTVVATLRGVTGAGRTDDEALAALAGALRNPTGGGN